MKKTKIAHVITELDVGGTEKSLLTLLPHLTGFDHHVYCAMGKGVIGKALEQKGIPVTYLNIPSRYDPQGITRLYTALRANKPDKLITYLIYADIVGRIAGKLAGVNDIISCQRSSLHKRGYLRLPDRLTATLVSHYVTQTKHAQKIVARALHIPEKKITVIPNAVAENTKHTEREPIRKELNIDKKTTVLTCVSNLRPGKGHATLLEAFQRIHQQNPQTCLVLVGDGPLKETLQTEAAATIPRTAIKWLGLRHDIPELLAASDIFILPTLAESMSNALLEAMAAQLPCIVSDIPANKELITDKENGLLFTTGNAQDLTTKTLTLINNPQVQKKLGTNAHAYTKQHHSNEHIVRQWNNLLRS